MGIVLSLFRYRLLTIFLSAKQTLFLNDPKSDKGTFQLVCKLDMETSEFPRVKSVHIRSYSGLHFLAFGPNTERYGVPLLIQSECGKMRTRITPNTD